MGRKVASLLCCSGGCCTPAVPVPIQCTLKHCLFPFCVPSSSAFSPVVYLLFTLKQVPPVSCITAGPASRLLLFKVLHFCSVVLSTRAFNYVCATIALQSASIVVQMPQQAGGSCTPWQAFMSWLLQLSGRIDWTHCVRCSGGRGQ